MGDERLPVIGSYCLCNTAAVCVHEIDHAEDKVLASINGIEPEWCSIEEHDGELGFTLGSFFVPFSEVMRV